MKLKRQTDDRTRMKVLTLIPVIVLAVTVICMVLAALLEVPTDRGVLYSILAFVGLMSAFISPVPCLVISVIGTVLAAKAAKEGAAEARIFLVLGITEILVYVMGAVMAIMIFTVVQGV